MSDNKNTFDDLLNDLEALKAKYSQRQPAEEPKPIKKAPQPIHQQEEAAPAPLPPVEEPVAVPVYNEPAPVKKQDDDISVYEDLIINDNGKESYESAEEYEEPAEKPQKAKASKGKKKKKKSGKGLIAVLIVFILVVIWGALFAVDYVSVSGWNDPIFCIKTAEYENGSKDFTGLFYRFEYHIDANGDISYDIMPWFMKGHNNEFKSEPKKLEDTNKAEQVNAQPSSNSNSPVEITIPKEFLEEEATEELELTAEQKSSGYNSVTANKDGSVTYSLTESAYRSEVANIKLDVANKLQSLANGEDFKSIKKVEYTDDFSAVTLYVDKAIYTTSLDSFAAVSVDQWTGYYHSFAKLNPVCDITVLDFADNSVIDESKG